ncbi:MAG: NIPSNAP family protein [Nitrospinota bacterium]
MIYEMRTYTLRPRTIPEFLARFAEALPHREKYSKPTAYWYSEVGPLNQVIHVWEYEDGVARARIREAASRDPNWPPKTAEFILAQESKILLAPPFRAEPRKGELGGIYEIRTYTYQPGTIPRVIERWSGCIASREKLSPLAACWYTEVGPLNQWIHVWPYADLNERARIRQEAMKLPDWPPKTREWVVNQESRVVIPAPFSPMR